MRAPDHGHPETRLAGGESLHAHYGPLGYRLAHVADGADRPFLLRYKVPGATIQFGYASIEEVRKADPHAANAISEAMRS